ncbi:MAG: glycolate oxidase subunit GlcE [Betaproteobacteria bacterium]
MSAEALIPEWRERVRTAQAKGAPLRIRGGGTKDFYGERLEGEIFDVSAHAGIIDYDPTELVITARGGTTLSEIETALADADQFLGFEPPHFGPGATLGGCIATGLSGPRRPYAGAVRDFVLGVRVLDGKGDDLRFGGRVMKNVAGFDVSRLMTGALGTLGVLLEVSLKCLPRPKSESTLVFVLSAPESVRKVNEWAGQPLPLSASAWHEDRLYVRLSGAEAAVNAAKQKLGGDTLAVADAQAWWTNLREQRMAFYSTASQLWRLSVKSTAPYMDLGTFQMIEWGGAIRWLNSASVLDAVTLREWSQRNGGHATLFRSASRHAGVFHPLTAPVLAIHQRLKSTFDPSGILNRGRMFADF